MLWKIQRHAYYYTTVAIFAHLDGPVDSAQLRAWHQELVAANPRFAHRVGGSNRRPRWEPDPHFTVDRHVLRVSLPIDADEARLQHLMLSLVNTPLPADTAPWQAYLIDGAPDGRVLYVLKTVHALADGLRLMELFNGRRSPIGADPSGEAAGRRERAARGLARARLWYRLTGSVIAPTGTEKETEKASGVRQYALYTVPRTDLKQAAEAAGGTANDVLLCAVARGVARYRSQQHGRHPTELSVMTMVGRRHLSAPHAGNNITFASLVLPTRDDIGEALRGTRAAVEASGGSRPADVAALASRLAAVMPPSLLVAGLRHLARRHDVMVTNVPLSRDTISIAGRAASAVFGIAPLLGTSIVVAMLSYRETCHITVNVDPARIADLPVLVHCLRAAFDEITAWGTGH
jgi:hypothetical protein